MERNQREIDIGGGRKAMATPIPFRSSVEHWNEYLLDDGTVIKLKLVATEAFRLEGAYTPEGYPQYIVRSNNIMVGSSPESMRKK